MNTFFDSLSNGETTLIVALLSAGISAGVSLLTARYIIKHGPNYEEQIDSLHETIGTLARTQEELRKQQAEQAENEQNRHELQEKRAEAARWKPKVWIISKVENNDQVNILRLESSEEFALLRVSLCVEGGAVIHDYPTEGLKVTTKGFTLQITRESLNKIANHSASYSQLGVFGGSLRYTVHRGGQDYTGRDSFPCRGSS